jgi:RNA polymerase sigma-70 factor, ECF subfamily
MPQENLENWGADFVYQLSQSQNQIFSYILTLVPNWSDAEDILQDTSVTMWNKYGCHQKIEYFTTLGIHVAQNLIRQYYRKKKTQDRFLDDDVLEQIAVHAGEISPDIDSRIRLLHVCLSKLSSSDMELVRYRYESGYTIKQIANISNRSASGMYKVIGRIHDTILRCIRRRLALENT